MNKWPDIDLVSPWGRLTLRKPKSEDDVAVIALRTHPETFRYLPFMPTNLSLEKWTSRREHRAAQDDIWDFHGHFTANPAGPTDPLNPILPAQCTIMHIDFDNRTGEIGLLVHPSLHRSGVATELLYMLLTHAFEYPDLKLHRVEFVTASNNVQMRGWLEKYGIVHECTFREKWTDGGAGWIDAVEYGILEREWPAIKAKMKEWLDLRLGNSSSV